MKAGLFILAAIIFVGMVNGHGIEECRKANKVSQTTCVSSINP